MSRFFAIQLRRLPRWWSENNGPWLSDEKICQIGEPLKSGKDVGLGLGLYICQMIVENYGANMRFARADVHGGICTTVTIPLAEKSL